jgi:hypothetical protein
VKPPTRHKLSAGFFIADLLLSVASLAVLGAVYYAGAQRTSLRKQAEEVKQELAAVAEAMAKVDKAAAAPSGVPVDFSTLRPFLKGDSRLAKTGADALGHPFTGLILGQPPGVPAATASQLSRVADSAFWLPFPAPQP